jgi:zinc-binding alcohol dehydrogenase/oxidoreductase
VRAGNCPDRDNWITKRMYPNIREGCTLGADACGVALNGQHKGQLVILDPSIAWGDSEGAPSGSLEILGTPRDGSFADSVVVPEQNVYLKPAHLTPQQAAALPLAGVTAYRALVTKGKAGKGSRVLVTGIGGGVAVCAAQFALALGCEVYVTSSSQDKLKGALGFGCKGGVLYTQDQWGKALLKQTASKPFDVVVDGSGGEGLGECLRVLGGGGRLVTYGSTAGPTAAAIGLPQLFLKQAELLGTAMGSPRDFAAMLALVNDKRIVPIVDSVFALKDFPRALDKMRVSSQLGKIVLDHQVASL